MITRRLAFQPRWAALLRTLGAVAATALLLAGLGAGCLGKTTTTVMGSQTHFLRNCSEDCGDGLECLCGVCTRRCELGADCSDLALAAQCAPAQGSCASEVVSCTLECSQDSDCERLGADMTCTAGHCGGPALSASSWRASLALPARVGEPCITEDERSPDYSGASVGEVNLDASGASCGPGLVCLGNHFQGRVTCPEGQAAGGGCATTNGDPLRVEVRPQLESRPANLAVVCSCRCAGPARGADYCSCPSGMRCEDVASGVAGPLAGSYCTSGFDELLATPQPPEQAPTPP